MRRVRSHGKSEVRHVDAIEPYPVVLSVNPDLIRIPLPKRAYGHAARRLKVIHGAGLVNSSTVRLSQGIDLHFEAEIYCGESSVVVSFAPGIWEPYEDP